MFLIELSRPHVDVASKTRFDSCPPKKTPPLPSMASNRRERISLFRSVARKDSSITMDAGNTLPRASDGFGVSTSLFQTASNKTINLSSAGLARAKALLGLEEFQSLSLSPEATNLQFKQIASNATCVTPQGNSSNKRTPNSFISPLRSSSPLFRSVPASNLIKKFDAALDDRPLASVVAVHNSMQNRFIPRADQPLRSDTAYGDNSLKRRLPTTVSVSSFKRPRISSFETQHASNGKQVCVPPDFNSIKCNEDPVPMTLVGITRIYPTLYKERLVEKNVIVRSERMESQMVQLHRQRRSALIERLICECERGINGVNSSNDHDNEEGAKVYKLLETSEEPEFLMADMSVEQLTACNRYQAKFEAAMLMQNKKSVAKALEDAGLGERDVIPFMRIRLVGLTSLSYEGKHNPKEGMVTIWNPTERQRTELTEGKMYSVNGLGPVNSDSELLYLHGEGSSSGWQPLSPKASESFQPFFNPREPLSLLGLSEIPLSSEFDIAAYVVFVGGPYTDGQETKQWVFVTDGSSQCSKNLLAISFSTPSMNDLPIPQISDSLVGSVVGFCNLIKRETDGQNNILVGVATENSAYFINAEDAYSSHLKTRTAQIQKWAKLSSSNSVIQALRQRVLSVVSNRNAPSCSR